MQIEIDTSGFDLLKVAKQIDYAMSGTINDLAFDIKKTMAKEVKGKFGGSALPLAQSFGVRKSDKKNLVAETMLNDGSLNKNGIDYNKKIGVLFRGGRRHHRKSEGRMMYNNYMQRGEYAVFGEEAPLTKRGYITGANYVKILSQIKAGSQGAGYMSNATGSKRSKRKRKKRGYFVSKKNDRRTRHLPEGVWQRDGADVVPILIFVDDAYYKQMFDLYDTSSKVIKRRLNKYYIKNMSRALKTAR